MAKPIRATPSLNRSETEQFIKIMSSVEKRSPTKLERKLIKAINV